MFQAIVKLDNYCQMRLIAKYAPFGRLFAILRMVLYHSVLAARVAELADAPDLGSGIREDVGVRVPPFARIINAGGVGWK